MPPKNSCLVHGHQLHQASRAVLWVEYPFSTIDCSSNVDVRCSKHAVIYNSSHIVGCIEAGELSGCDYINEKSILTHSLNMLTYNVKTKSRVNNLLQI